MILHGSLMLKALYLSAFGCCTKFHLSLETFFLFSPYLLYPFFYQQRQDLWSHRLLASIDRPLRSLPYRFNVLRCDSFLFSGQDVAIPSMKTAVAALKR